MSLIHESLTLRENKNRGEREFLIFIKRREGVNKKKGDGGSADVEEEAMATVKDDRNEGRMKEVFC